MTTSLVDQLFSMFLVDEKAAVLPDVLSLLNDVSQNGVTIAGLPLVVKALTAVEADGIMGGTTFIKQAAGVLSGYITMALAPPAPPAPPA